MIAGPGNGQNPGLRRRRTGWRPLLPFLMGSPAAGRSAPGGGRRDRRGARTEGRQARDRGRRPANPNPRLKSPKTKNRRTGTPTPPMISVGIKIFQLFHRHIRTEDTGDGEGSLIDHDVSTPCPISCSPHKTAPSWPFHEGGRGKPALVLIRK